MNCRAAESLLVRDVDGVLDAAEQSSLESHLTTCAGCRERQAGHAAVRHVLVTRPPAAVPRGFRARLDARLEGADGGWLDRVDWRRSAQWAVPVAAALLLAAVLGRGRVASDPAADVAEIMNTWTQGGETGSSETARYFRADLSDEDVLGAMLLPAQAVNLPRSGDYAR